MNAIGSKYRTFYGEYATLVNPSRHEPSLHSVPTNWSNRSPTPFVALFGSRELAVKWAKRNFELGYDDVFLLKLDATKLGQIFRVNNDEFLVLRKVSRRSIIRESYLTSIEEESDTGRSSEESSEHDVFLATFTSRKLPDIGHFECSKNQVPNPLFRVRYSGNQSLQSRCKASFKTTRDFKTAVELHLKWCSCEPTPFVSLFADHEHATKWAQRLLEHGYTDVILLEIDSTKLGSLFNVRELVDHQEIETSLPEYLYQDEFLVLHEIPKASIITKTIVNRSETSVNYDSSDSSEEEIDTPLSRYLKALDVEYEKRFSDRMAESLYHLGDLLTWTPTSAPRGQLVLLQDCVEAGGAFLVHHFTSLFLKAGHRVCFVASANTIEHYAAVGRKLGVNFAACATKKQLKVVNWGEMETKEAEWTMLFEELKSFTQEEQDADVSIIVDDISPFKWRFGDAAVLDFVRCCKTLTHDKNGAANVVLLAHADTDVATSRSLSSALADMATVVLSTKPLATGYSKDVHGTLEVCCQNQGDEPVAVAYKVLESTIKCFRSGGQALRWN